MTISKDNEAELDQWSRRLMQALQILNLKVETGKIVGLADNATGAVAPGAGALTAFYVGYAAAQDALVRSGDKLPGEAVRDAAAIAERLAADGAHGGPDSVGFAGTGQ